MLKETLGCHNQQFELSCAVATRGEEALLVQSGFTKWALTRRISTALHICGQQYRHKPESGHGTPKIQEQSYNLHLVT